MAKAKRQKKIKTKYGDFTFFGMLRHTFKNDFRVGDKICIDTLVNKTRVNFPEYRQLDDERGNAGSYLHKRVEGSDARIIGVIISGVTNRKIHDYKKIRDHVPIKDGYVHLGVEQPRKTHPMKSTKKPSPKKVRKLSSKIRLIIDEIEDNLNDAIEEILLNLESTLEKEIPFDDSMAELKKLREENAILKGKLNQIHRATE